MGAHQSNDVPDNGCVRDSFGCGGRDEPGGTDVDCYVDNER